MRICLLTLLMLTSQLLWAQQDTVVKHRFAGNPFRKHSFTGTIAVGFIDQYRKSYSMPVNFEKQNTSGFSPVYVKAEYGISNNISIAATFTWDDFNYNFNQLYNGFGGTVIRRPRVNHFRLFSGGLTGYYHLGNAIRVKRLDPFIGLGFTLNNIRYSNFPQGDSTVIKKEHTAAIYAKAGARYYVTEKFAVYGDVGYDHLTLFSLGASCTVGGKGVYRSGHPKAIGAETTAP
jgi:hypothetical protein